MQIVVIPNFQDAIEKAKEILHEKVDKKTVLFLSGGATPKSLYTILANEKVIQPAAVGMVDERYGKKLHETSNERMIKETGFLDYLDTQHIPFHPILPDVIARSETTKQSNKRLPRFARNDKLRQKASENYDQITRDLFFHFPKSIAIMGVGVDGHISSIIPNRKDFTDPMFEEGKKQLFVGDFNDTKSDYKERIGMTFAGLALIDYFIVLVFGKEKKLALKKMFESGPLEEIPARFFMQQASNNTVIITDQQV